MLRKIHEIAALTGVSVRTLRYYDQIGLLPPTSVTRAGYRLYGDEALDTLRQILFFRELDFPLKEIAAIMTAPNYDRRGALSRHRELLLAQRRRLDGLIALVESTLQGETDMDFHAFDQTELEAARAEYAQEARARWGGTKAYAESLEKSAGRTGEQWRQIQAGAGELLAAFGAMAGSDPASPAAQALVGRWRDHLSAHFYTCTNEILAGLGALYVSDPRFTQSLNRYGAGTAAFVSAAIAHFCKD